MNPKVRAQVYLGKSDKIKISKNYGVYRIKEILYGFSLLSFLLLLTDGGSSIGSSSAFSLSINIVQPRKISGHVRGEKLYPW